MDAVVRYASTADGLQIAYQVLGEGPIDIVIIPGLMSNVDHNADYPFYGAYVRRFPRFARTLVLDRRGAGISDREVGSGSAEDRMDDVRAVMDAVGCRRAALLGHREGGSIAILFAATYPERVSALVLRNTAARDTAAPDYPAGLSVAAAQRFVAAFTAVWGTGRAAFQITSDAPDEEAALRALGFLERSIATPRAIARQLEFGMKLDVRSALPLVEVPTLVMHSVTHAQEKLWEAQARYTSEHIRGARYVESPGGGSWDALKQDAICDVIEEFLTGHRPPESDLDRVLATVLFTDIVDSTRRTAELGDRRWRAVLDAHDLRAVAAVERFRGQVVKHTGDGMLATFDGPARAVRCASAVIDAAHGLNLQVRAGLHTGEVEVRGGGDVSGLTVHIGARIGALAGADEVLVSSTVRDLVVGSGLEFDERGEHELRGIEGRWRLLALRFERNTH